MEKTTLASEEQKRLQELLDYRILDTQSEPDYDDIVWLAQAICEKPIAVIGLMDRNREWFKSQVGFNMCEVPRKISFCNQLIHEKTICIIPDLSLDPRFSKNPVVTHPPHIRFYAGAPLMSRNGYNLGMLCVMDFVPGDLKPFQKLVLQVLARQVTMLFELRRSNQVLEEKIKLISDQESKLLYSAKMVSLGEMAGAIAHEINNPLSAVANYAGVLRMMFKRKDVPIEKVNAIVGSIEKTTFRIAKIVKGMKSFARDAGNDPFETVALQSILDDALALGEDKFKSLGVRVQLGTVPLGSYAKCRPGQVLQILSNLMTNSLDAIQFQPEKWILLDVKERGHFWDIYVVDSGRGIEPELRGRIMEPFFTTKPPQKGTGLGLSISKTLAESQGGRLRYENQSANTAFVLSIPKGIHVAASRAA